MIRKGEVERIKVINKNTAEVYLTDQAIAQYQAAGSDIKVTAEDGSEIFSYDPGADAVVGEHARQYMGAVISCPNFRQGDSYQVYVAGQQMMYTGTDVRKGPGGFGGPPGGFGGDRPQWPEGDMPDNAPPEGFDGQMPEGFEGFPGEMPEGFEGFNGQMPEGWTPGQKGERPEGFDGQRPEGFEGKMPEGFEGFPGEMPEGFEGFVGQMPGGDRGERPSGEGSTLFYMQDKVNCFSGITVANK